MDIIIWGAGNWGERAYWHYKNKGKILAYVDIDDKKKGKNVPWGEVCVQPVTYIHEHKDAMVVVAVSRHDGIADILNSMGVNRDNIVYFSPSILGMQNVVLMNELNENRSIDLGEFLKKTKDIKLKCTFRCFGSGVLDYAFLRAIALKYNVKKYLEIGTYIGESLKAVSDICDQCYSITAPRNSVFSMANLCRTANYPDFTDRLADDDNVEHHYGDSKEFDWNVIPRDIDLYFIDGDHSYRGVYCDTENVFKHKKDSSIIIWHDFKNSDPRVKSSEVASAVRDAIGDEFNHVYSVDNNMCGIYLPGMYHVDFSLKSDCWTEERQALYVYELDVRCVKQN